MQDFAGIFIMILFHLGYIWAAKKFCKEYLETSRVCEKLFVIALFISGILLNFMNKRYPVPYIFFALLSRTCFIGLVSVLFWGNTEKKILIA